MEKNLGHATAYGYAKSKGYSGTEEEFAQLMADYASVGQSAAQSAEQAAASATSASGSATTASQAAQTATSKASEAVTAAGTATTKASEASQSATSASQSAESAGTSAQTATTAAATATTKASEASESATTASTAKTDAETARDAAAQSASEAAESARTLTIDATLTQNGQAADAKVVGDEIEGVKDDLNDKLEKTNLVTPLNILDVESIIVGYMATNGTTSASNSYRRTDKIEVSEGEVITAWRSVNNSFNTSANSVNMRFICAFDSTGEPVPNKGASSAVSSYTVPEGITHIVISIEATYFGYDVAIIKSSINPNYIAEYFEPYNSATPEFLPLNYQVQSGRFTVNADTYSTELLLPEINVIKEVVITFSCKLGNNFTSISIGDGISTTPASYSSFLTVDNTNVVFTINGNQHTFAHGITVADYIYVSIHVRSDTKADIVVQSGAGVYARTIGWYGFSRDKYKARIVGSATDCVFTVYLANANANTFAFGDSYMAIIESPERWPHWMINAGFGNNALFNACSGENSNEAVRAFQNILRVGKPKYLFWALGMNDGSDTDINTPSAQWLHVITFVLSMCNKYNIIPVLATVPTVPSYNHEGKNKWVRESGYRYVDFAKAVGADSTGAWYSGMLSSDSVHPTELGAKALWNRVQIDFPEII